MRIGIHANGDARVGLGHLGRCMALAQALAESGHRPVFLNVSKDCLDWVRGHGFGTAALGARSWDVLIADSYEFTARDHLVHRRRSRTLLVVDDFGGFRHPCDWILSSHVYAHRLDFSRVRAAGFLVGPRFHLLRREYWTPAAARSAPRRVRELLVTLGGGDGWGLGARAAAELARGFPRVRVHLILGPLSQTHALGLPGRVVVHRSPPSLRPIGERCDAALSAGGQTLYELAFLGVPAAVVNLGGDQDGNISGMTAAGAAVSLGKPSRTGFAGRLVRAMRRLDTRPSDRSAMSLAGRRLLDGRGALRVARLLAEGG